MIWRPLSPPSKMHHLIEQPAIMKTAVEGDYF